MSFGDWVIDKQSRDFRIIDVSVHGQLMFLIEIVNGLEELVDSRTFYDKQDALDWAEKQLEESC